MGLSVILQNEHEISGFSGFGFLGDKIFSFGSGVAFKEPKKFIADGVIIIIFFE